MADVQASQRHIHQSEIVNLRAGITRRALPVEYGFEARVEMPVGKKAPIGLEVHLVARCETWVFIGLFIDR
jgi:hypothetical protein